MKPTAALICLAWLLLPHDASIAASPSTHRTITCPYLGDEELKLDVPAKRGDLPKIEFDYPSKVTRFVFREDAKLLVVAMDQDEPSRVRIVVSAQLNKATGSYDGQFVVDLGGNELQLRSGPVSCRVSR